MIHPALRRPVSQPDFPTVRVQVLRPFKFRPVRWVRGLRLPLDVARRVEPDETLDMIQPDAESMAALGRVEILF